MNKGRILSSILIFLSLCVAVPYSVYGNRVKVNTVKAENINYTPYINLNGSIEEKDYERNSDARKKWNLKFYVFFLKMQI